MKRALLAIVPAAVLLVAAAAGPGAASAAIDAYQNSEEATHLGEIKRGKCTIKRRPNGAKVFHAQAKTTNGAYEFSVLFLDFRGFGRDYQVEYGGVPNPAVDFEGRDGSDYSSAYPFPGTPPGAAGGIRFPNDRKLLSIGVYALPNADYSQGVALAGAMRCRYPRR